MRIQWLYLLLALGLMVPPTPLPADFRKALRRSNVNHPEGVAWVWQNWWDLVRAALGVYFLMQHAIVGDGQLGADDKALVLQTVVLGVVLLAQIIRMLHTVQLLAPVFYLCGMTLMLGGFDSSFFHIPLPISGAFAVGVGWLFAIGGKNLGYQLPAMAVAVAVAGCVLGPPLPLMVNCGLILFPMLLSVLFKKRLWFAASAPAGA